MRRRNDNMKCARVEQWISFVVDGERLPGNAQKGLDEHLEACPACRSLLRLETERADTLQRALGAGPEGSPGLLSRILVAARSEAGAVDRRGGLWALPPFPRRLAVPSLSLAAAAVVVAGAAFLWRSPPTPMERSGPPVVESASELQMMVEHDSWNTDVVPDDSDGGPLGRSVFHSRRIYGLPAGVSEPGRPAVGGRRAPGAGKWILELDGYDTRYVKLATWPYQ
jgi:hypothetical protein